MLQQSDVTIIIPHIFINKETEFALRECLKSLDETVPDVKKIIAINGMKFENDFDIVKYPNVEFMVLERQGQCIATNAAIATTNTPWVFVSNNDMIYPPGWFERLVAHQEMEENLCMSPKLIEPRSGAPTFEVFFAGGAGGDFNKDIWLEFAKKYMEERDVITRPGFNLPFLIHRELWDTTGGYDINYDPWGSNSDSDLLYKIKLAGVLPIQDTSSIVYHFSQTSGTFEPRNQGAWQKNWDYFIEKWGFPRTDDGIWEASFDIPNEGRKFRPDWEGKYVN